MSYIGDEIKINHINHYEQQVAGFYTGPKVIKKVVSQFPFGLTNNIDSTIARIITLYKWNELTSWPQFLRQKIFNRVFRFKIKGFTQFYNNLWELDLSVKASSVENKIAYNRMN